MTNKFRCVGHVPESHSMDCDPDRVRSDILSAGSHPRLRVNEQLSQSTLDKGFVGHFQGFFEFGGQTSDCG